jgi:drug/metabolite transporter (DMT)-like permease
MSTPPRTFVGISTVTIGIAFAVLAAGSFAGTGFVANELADEGTPGVVVGFYEALFGMVLVVAVNARRLRTMRMTRPALAWALAAGALFAAAFGSFYTGLSRIDYSVGAPILGAVPLVSYVVLLFVLRGHERITRRALAGAFLVVAGVGIIGLTI